MGSGMGSGTKSGSGSGLVGGITSGSDPGSGSGSGFGPGCGPETGGVIEVFADSGISCTSSFFNASIGVFGRGYLMLLNPRMKWQNTAGENVLGNFPQIAVRDCIFVELDVSAYHALDREVFCNVTSDCDRIEI